MLSINLKGKVAIVTGVSNGIGAGVAKVLAQAGCHVAGCARTQESDPKIEGFKKSILENDTQVFYDVVDVTNKNQLREFVEKTAQKFGKIDIVISNAGANMFKGAEKCTDDEWSANHELNLASHWQLAKAAKPWLEKSRQGVFIVMTSNHAYSSIKGCFPYNVTKTALTGLVRAMAIEWGPTIRVLGIAPGYIDTPGNDEYIQSHDDPTIERERIIKLHPVGKLGTAEEIGGWCAFLSSKYSAFATGVTYLIDGGRSAIMQDS
ncbi:MAG: SDR family oxidoreductase [Bacteroidota bacterium]